jgi:hypothetical protein
MTFGTLRGAGEAKPYAGVLPIMCSSSALPGRVSRCWPGG